MNFGGCQYGAFPARQIFEKNQNITKSDELVGQLPCRNWCAIDTEAPNLDGAMCGSSRSGLLARSARLPAAANRATRTAREASGGTLSERSTSLASSSSALG